MPCNMYNTSIDQILESRAARVKREVEELLFKRLNERKTLIKEIEEMNINIRDDNERKIASWNKEIGRYEEESLTNNFKNNPIENDIGVLNTEVENNFKPNQNKNVADDIKVGINKISANGHNNDGNDSPFKLNYNVLTTNDCVLENNIPLNYNEQEDTKNYVIQRNGNFMNQKNITINANNIVNYANENFGNLNLNHQNNLANMRCEKFKQLFVNQSINTCQNIKTNIPFSQML
ncbi:hypothetical protein COBT_003885, partial [Conglomerata obtusa]